MPSQVACIGYIGGRSIELSLVQIMLRSEFNRPAFSIRGLKSFLQFNPLDQSLKVSPTSFQRQCHLLQEEPSVTHRLRDGGDSGRTSHSMTLSSSSQVQ